MDPRTSPRDIGDHGIYVASPSHGALTQCEILSKVCWGTTVPEPTGSWVERRKESAFSIVLSQSCDLAWDHNAREREQWGSDKCMTSVLLVPLELATDIRGRGGDGRISSDQWALLKRNTVDRFHFLEAVPSHGDRRTEGLPELVADFKQYFSLPTADLYQQMTHGAGRRARLQSPYLEHFVARFFNYQARVALPRPHASV